MSESPQQEITRLKAELEAMVTHRDAIEKELGESNRILHETAASLGSVCKDYRVVSEALNKTKTELEACRARVTELEIENTRRIRHLNRLGTWAQQDPTGPWHKQQIQEWVLGEIKAALGSIYEPTAWMPDIHALKERTDSVEKERDEARRLLKQLCKAAKSLIHIVDRNIVEVDNLKQAIACAEKEIHERV